MDVLVSILINCDLDITKKLEVTEAIAKYPALIDVVKAMLRSPGISSSLSGKYTFKGYAEKQLVRTCMTMEVIQ